ncbi:MAG TPA: M23 family metallopeptidase [Verrucomicrobiae bacterium]|nr:M23 family metallopeptidase [Verrucomicrobiae bacterium]
MSHFIRATLQQIRRFVCSLSIASRVAAAIWFAYFMIGTMAFAEPRGIAAGSTDATRVRIAPRREGEVTHVYVENSELGEVTMTFCFSAQNLKSSVAFPHTGTFAPGKTEGFMLTPIDSAQPWEYAYTNYYKLGSSVAEHDDSVLYLLPYTDGKTFRVTQGYNGTYSHTGSNQYATDWKMPEGTPVRAARGGMVVKVRDNSRKGGASMKYDRYNNYIVIRHEDGTMAQYCHLQMGGAKVVPGQMVHAGDLIALSGNTGFSSGAHLHFCVFKTKDGMECVSIPVKFKGEDGAPVTLFEGQAYKATAIRMATAAASRRLAAASPAAQEAVPMTPSGG